MGRAERQEARRKRRANRAAQEIEAREERRLNGTTENLHENISSADKRTNHPELYTAKAQPAAEDEVADLLWALVRLLKPDWVLETGTAFGHTAGRICDALEQNTVGHLITLEARESRIEEAQALLASRPATVVPTKYQEYSPPSTVRFGLCFFDATRRDRDKEYRHFRPWIDDGAVLVFHDTGAQHPGMKGVKRLEDADLITSMYFPTPRGVSVGRPKRNNGDDQLPGTHSS